jgi:hypothetical protein
MEEGVGLEPTTGWIPLLVFGTSSSSSRTPSIIYKREGRIRTGAGVTPNASAGRRNKPLCHLTESGAGRNRTHSAAFGEQLAAMALSPEKRLREELEPPNALKDRSPTSGRNCGYRNSAKERMIQLSKTRGGLSSLDLSFELWFEFRERDPLPID